MLSVLINTHMLLAARDSGVERFFYSSSACVYNGEKQKDPRVIPLKEADAYPALPEDGYGWRNSSASGCADTLKKTLECNAEWRAITTFMDRLEPGPAGGKRRLPGFAGGSRSQAFG